MRKSKNYYKFMEYMAFGISGWHEDAVMVDNGVIECVAYAKVAHIEDYSKLYECNYDKMAMDSDNTWLTIKCVLVNEEVINVYYVTNERNLYIGQLVLDDYRTQKQALDAIHKKVVCFFLNSRQFCEFHPAEEEINEYEEILESGEEVEETPTRATIEIPYVDIDCSNLKKVPKNSIYGMFGNMSLPCRVCTHFCTRTDTYNYTMEYCCRKNKENEKKAIENPEWHHVSLATLANIDFDMLDEKRKVYLYFYKKWQEARKNLRKCSCGNSYERCCRVFRRSLTIALEEDRISKTLVEYFDRQISMVNVECGVWSSMVEVATGQHDSRKYNRATLRY